MNRDMHRRAPCPTSALRWSRIACGVLLLAGYAASAAANTINVDTLEDQFGEDMAHCGLREAIQAANTDAPFGGCSTGQAADIIMLMPGVYRLTRSGAGEDGNVGGDLDIIHDVNIIAASGFPDATVIDGGQADRVFDISNKASVILQGLTIRGGNADLAALPSALRYGGGVRLTGNSFAQFSSVVLDGNAARSGGGVYISDGSAATFNRSAVVRNAATGTDGGGVTLAPGGSFLTMYASTVSDNSAARDGGGIEADTGLVTLNNLTIVGNSANTPLSGGGGIDVFGSAVADITNSIVANNWSGDTNHRDCAGTLQQFDTSLMRSPGGCTLPAAMNGTLLGVDPLLTELGDFGGHTLVHHPRNLSPAINAGSTVPAGSINSCLSVDQRGKGWQGACDMGAVQWNMDFVVTRTDDAVSTNINSNVCHTSGGGCTLRAAIQQASSLGSGSTNASFFDIYLPATEITLSLPGANEGFSVSGDLNLNAHINLFGHAGFSNSGVNAAQLDGAFVVNSSAAFVDMNIRNGDRPGGQGGAIRIATDAHATLDFVRIHDNAAQDGGGIYIDSRGALSASHCAVFDNVASGAGGGILQDFISGPPDLYPQFPLLLTNCTIAHNQAGTTGGGIASLADHDDAAQLSFATVAGNSAPRAAFPRGGGIYVASTVAQRPFSITNSIVADNLGGPQNGISDCEGALQQYGHNVIPTQVGACTITGSGTSSAADPLLRPFDKTGFAPTYTFPLTIGSPAFAAVPAGACRDALGRTVQTDQRDVDRGVMLFDVSTFAAPCAAGAYEGEVDLIFANGFEPVL